MSIPVKIEDLATALKDFDVAYLLSMGANGIKVVCVEVTADADGLTVPTGSGGTARNLELNPSVTLMCPPRQRRGYTLLVDGTAVVDGDGFRITPSGAVLHRPAAHGDAEATDDSCGHDCQPLDARHG